MVVVLGDMLLFKWMVSLLCIAIFGEEPPLLGSSSSSDEDELPLLEEDSVEYSEESAAASIALDNGF